MRDDKDDERRLARLEAAARGASGMLWVAARGDAEGTVSRRRLVEVMTAAAELLDQALSDNKKGRRN